MKFFSAKKIPISMAIILLFLGIVFLVIGIALGDYNIIFRKAIFICLECIGIA